MAFYSDNMQKLLKLNNSSTQQFDSISLSLHKIKKAACLMSTTMFPGIQSSNCLIYKILYTIINVLKISNWHPWCMSYLVKNINDYWLTLQKLKILFTFNYHFLPIWLYQKDFLVGLYWNPCLISVINLQAFAPISTQAPADVSPNQARFLLCVFQPP